MAGAMRKMAVYLGLVEEDLDAEYEQERPDSRPAAGGGDLLPSSPPSRVRA